MSPSAVHKATCAISGRCSVAERPCGLILILQSEKIPQDSRGHSSLVSTLTHVPDIVRIKKRSPFTYLVHSSGHSASISVFFYLFIVFIIIICPVEEYVVY